MRAYLGCAFTVEIVTVSPESTSQQSTSSVQDDPTDRDSGWQPDGFLDHYEVRTFDLGPDPDGEDPITATLVRKPTAPAAAINGAVLYVHGFTDYFFHEPLADHFHDRGYAFYALDLRKCGRSLLDGQTPHFVRDLAAYDLELGLALDAIADDFTADTPVLIAAHSTGGLITPLWLDRLRTASPERHARVSGLLLNSPWLDLQGKPVLRSYPVTMVVKGLAAVRPFETLTRELSAAYGESLHVDSHGEWAYDLTKKPLGGFPVTFGFLNAVRSGQRHLHHGIDVGVPTLVLRSDATKFAKSYSPAVDAADVVLDVTQIARWSGSLGGHVTIAPIAGARHDVFLSVESARTQAYSEVDRWLDTVVDPSPARSAS
ncbi:lysophospholipase [Mycobacteroides abscessus subsp. abscessus]|nr:lysophospholipase [Mycobacteroides abscessus subsp. abscessus]